LVRYQFHLLVPLVLSAAVSRGCQPLYAPVIGCQLSASVGGDATQASRKAATLSLFKFFSRIRCWHEWMRITPFRSRLQFFLHMSFTSLRYSD
jgi:hypothetical protein